jgi:predicted nucleotidyltransferase
VQELGGMGESRKKERLAGKSERRDGTDRHEWKLLQITPREALRVAEGLRQLKRALVATREIFQSIEFCSHRQPKSLKPCREAIEVAFVYGSMARSEEGSASDVDLMVIGSARLSDLAPALKKAEEALGRAVNPSVYSSTEVVKKLSEGHHFLETVLKGEKFFLQGDERELAATLGK